MLPPRSPGDPGAVGPPGRRSGHRAGGSLATRTRSGTVPAASARTVPPAVVSVIADLAPVDGRQHERRPAPGGPPPGPPGDHKCIARAPSRHPSTHAQSGGVTSARNVARRRPARGPGGAQDVRPVASRANSDFKRSRRANTFIFRPSRARPGLSRSRGIRQSIVANTSPAWPEPWWRRPRPWATGGGRP